MPFSHHSHSGQFCDHAKNRLEEMVQAAISQGMQQYCMTEHMPRGPKDLYPEETEIGRAERGHVDDAETSRYLYTVFDRFVLEAQRLQRMYADKIELLVGIEIDWIRPSSTDEIPALLGKYADSIDLVIGSVHHVHEIPVDYSHELYLEAQEASGRGDASTLDDQACRGSEGALFADYFDLQFDMLRALQPRVIGHFDLIRLKSQDVNASFQRYGRVWKQILRNIDFVITYGGIFEINTAALRKGLQEPYPNKEICRAIIARGGRMTLSDDAHAIDQVGTHYSQAIQFCQDIGLERLVYLTRKETGLVHEKEISLDQVRRHVCLVNLPLGTMSRFEKANEDANA